MYKVIKRHRLQNPDGSIESKRYLGGGESTTTSKVEPWGPAQPSLERGLDWLNQWGDYVSNNQDKLIYQGPRVADWNDFQRQAAANIQNISDPQRLTPAYDWFNRTLAGDSGMKQTQQAALDAYGQVIQPTIRGDFLTTDTNPYAQAYIDRAIQPITENYQNVVQPNLRTSDAYGLGEKSATGLAEAQAANDYMRNIGETSAAMQFPMYNTERQNQIAASQLPFDMMKFFSDQEQAAATTGTESILNAYLKQQAALADVGQTVQARDQAQIAADREYQQEQIYNYLDAINSYLNSAYSLGSAGRTQAQQGGEQSFLQSLLGGGSAAASMLSSLLPSS